MTALGQTRWAIAEGYIPGQSSFSEPALISHETACILNAGDQAAHVRITIFFADREPVGPYLVTVPPRRTLHLRFNDLERPEPIPRDTPYSSLFDSDVYRSWCNTRGSIRDTLKSVCCRRPRMPRRRRARAPHRPLNVRLRLIPSQIRQFPGLECTASQMRNKFPS